MKSIIYLAILTLGLSLNIEGLRKDSHKPYTDGQSSKHDESIFDDGFTLETKDLIPRVLTPISTETIQIIGSLDDNNNAIVTIAVSPDGKILLLFDAAEGVYQLFDISDILSPTELGSLFAIINDTAPNPSVIISADSRTAFAVASYSDNSDTSDYTGELQIIDISNAMSPVMIANFSLPACDSSAIALSHDGQTCFVQSDCTSDAIITIIDVSNLEFPNILSAITYSYEANDRSIGGTTIALSLDDRTLFFTSGSRLHVFNVSDLEVPFEPNGTGLAINAIQVAISPDGNQAFVLTENDPYSIKRQTELHIIDISNPISLNPVSSVALGYPGLATPFVTVSPSGTDVFVNGGKSLMAIDVTDIYNPTSYNIDSMFGPSMIVITPDGRNGFVLSNQVTIIQMYFNSQIGQAFPIKENIIAKIPANIMSHYFSPFNQAHFFTLHKAISSNDKTMFLQHVGYFEIINISNMTSSSLLSAYDFNNSDCNTFVLSPDEKIAFVSCGSKMVVLNLSNLTSPTRLTVFSPIPQAEDIYIGNRANYISPDGQTLFLPTRNGFQILNISNLYSPVDLGRVNCSSGFFLVSYKFSKNGKTLFLAAYNEKNNTDDQFEIIDLSNLTSPLPLSSVTLTYPVDIMYISISPDEETVIISFDVVSANMMIFNVSNLTSPTQITGTWPNITVTTFQSIIFSQKSPSIFIMLGEYVLIVDISTLTLPNILRRFPIQDEGGAKVPGSMLLSPDESVLYIIDYSGEVTILSLESQYTVVMKDSSFVLGEVYSDTLMPLKRASNKNFNPLDKTFSFLQTSLYMVGIPDYTLQVAGSYLSTPVSYLPLPNWMLFDSDQGILTFSPSAADQVGQYQIYTVISTMIPTDAFVGIGSIKNETDSSDLFISLISLGYIDTRGYLTSSFYPNEKLFLSSQYSEFQSEIHEKLSEYYIEMTTPFSVLPSLSLIFSKQLAISTMSQNSLSIEIVLITGQESTQAQFVTSNYPAVATVSNNQSTITMQGSSIDINATLAQIIINLDNDITSCNGTVIVFDSLNPPLNLTVNDISAYFMINHAPVVNPKASIQSQVDQISIYTNEQFTIELNGTFIDVNDQSLEYSLTMQDPTLQVPEWLMIRGETITGTPPDQLSDSQINLIITAKNQFKSTRQTFTITIKISLDYALKLIGTYGGIMITVIGLWIYINRIYNILCKKRYRYPKNFIIQVGDESTVQRICPIAFISEEIKASKIILKEIQKMIAIELKLKSITDKDLIVYFFDSSIDLLQEEKLIHMIKSIMAETRSNGANELHGKPFPIGNLNKEVIKQLIINDIVSKELDSDQEIQTKKAFDTIKLDWINLIETTRDPWRFVLQREIIEEKLRAISNSSPKQLTRTHSEPLLNDSVDTSILNNNAVKIDPQKSRLGDDDISRDQNTIKEVHVIDKSEKDDVKARSQDINRNLLERALLAHAFNYHNLNINTIDVEIILNQKSFGTTLWQRLKEFLKRDLYLIERGKAGYEIRYKVRRGILRFYGVPDAELKDKTLAIQIVNRRGRILTEIWAVCLEITSEEEEMSTEAQLVL